MHGSCGGEERGKDGQKSSAFESYIVGRKREKGGVRSLRIPQRRLSTKPVCLNSSRTEEGKRVSHRARTVTCHLGTKGDGESVQMAGPGMMSGRGEGPEPADKGLQESK